MKYDYKVAEITKDKAVIFIQKYHYSPVFPKLTKHWLGFFLDNELVGVITLGWGTQPRQTINKMFPGLGTPHYFEIGKMCMSPEMPKNSESQMLSAAEKWIKQHKPDVLFFYTLADGIMGKVGYVYQSANFSYGGEYYTSVYLIEENGEKLHPRSARKLLEENAKMVGKEKLCWLTTDFMKKKGIKRIDGKMFRYIRPMSKKAKRLMAKESTIEWRNHDYPKAANLIWVDSTDRKEKREIEIPAFTFEDAKYNTNNINDVSPLDDMDLEAFMS